MDQITLFQFIRLLRLLLGILGFIGLFSLDLLKAWKSKAHWVPQGALVLSALSLQLLDLLDTQTVSITDYPASKEYDLVRVLRNELLVDGGRVMVCVYMGYLLPQMARSPSKRQLWSDIGALALSVLTNIFSELYAFKELYSNLRIAHIPVNPLSIASRVCTMVCAILHFLLLGSAVFAGRTIYDLVLEKIPLVVRREPEGYLTGSYRPEYVEQDVFQSWVVAWVCRPDYVIARSVLASSVGVVVTASVGCFAAEWITQNYQVLHFDDGIDWFRYTVTAFMTLLILIGWTVIFFRWMLAIFYFPGKYKIPNQRYLHLEDFWLRHIFEIMDDIQFRPPSWDKYVSGGGFLDNLKFLFLRAIRAHKWLRHLLLCLQRRVIWFSKLCCFLSEKIVFGDKTRSHIAGAGNSDFAGFGEALKVVKMPGETEQSLLAASLKALKQTKAFMEEGRKEGMASEGLIQFLRTQSIDQNFEGLKFLETLRARLDEVGNSVGFDYLKKFSWKLTTLSIIEVLLELEGPGATDAVEPYSQAYSQAYDFLDLLDNPAGTDKNYWGQLFATAAYK